MNRLSLSSIRFGGTGTPTFGSALLLACWCAGIQAAPADTAGTPSVQHACAVTMGLGAGSGELEACSASLRHAAAAAENQTRLRQRRAACGELGLAPGDSGFGGCVEHLASAINFQRYPLNFGE